MSGHPPASTARIGDMFCVGYNIFIDFDKIKGRHSTRNPPVGKQYLDFEPGHWAVEISFSLSSSLSMCARADISRKTVSYPYHDTEPLGLRLCAGSTFASCEQTARWDNDSFMPHAARQFRTFRAGAPEPVGSYSVERSPTYLLARFEGGIRMLSPCAMLFTEVRILTLLSGGLP